MTQNLIEVTNLSKSFQGLSDKALDSISFAVKAGEFLCLLGPDAAGKTTLLRILASVMNADAGEVQIMGKKIPQEVAEIQHLIGYMPQKFGLYEDLSVLENIELNADLRGIFGIERTQRIDELLEKTNLKKFSSRLAGRLSGGMKQKLSLACTLVAKPKILLLDEVSFGVDPISRGDLMAIVRSLKGDDTAIVWSTTYLDEANNADRLLLINQGHEVFQGKPQDFISRCEGRNFLLSAKDKNVDRRDNLNRVMQHEGVIDAVLQGDKVRVLCKNSDVSALENDYEITPTSTTIEDPFLESLNAKLPAFSRLATRYQKVTEFRKDIIEAQNLTKKFGDFAATDNVNFQIRSGQIFGFLGPNGAGKSTTFKMLCGLLKPTSGAAHVAGLSLLTSASEARQKIGYMAQKFSLYGELSVLQNLQFFAGVYGLDKQQSKLAIDEVVESLELQKFLHLNAMQLPLGIKQSLALGCAVLHKPEVLFLDEPTSGVDPATRREFWFHINALAHKGVTVMVTTHFMDEAEYCDRVAIIYKGLKIAEDDPQALKESIRGAEFLEPTFQDVFAELIRRHDLEEGKQ